MESKVIIPVMVIFLILGVNYVGFADGLVPLYGQAGSTLKIIDKTNAVQTIVGAGASVITAMAFELSLLNVPIGGTFIPIDQTALLLAGVQSISMWMIPVILAGIGIGVFVIKRKK